jgi:hypothetical protein
MILIKQKRRLIKGHSSQKHWKIKLNRLAELPGTTPNTASQKWATKVAATSATSGSCRMRTLSSSV